MRIEIHDQIPQSPSLREGWNALVGAMERPQVFYTWEWARSMESAYGHARPVRLLLAWDGETLAGVAPLTLDPGNRAEFLCATTADYCDLLTSPDHRREFVDAILRELRGMGCRDLVLANLPADSATVKALKAGVAHHGFHAFSRQAYDCAQVRLGTQEKREQLRSTLSKKKWFRYGLRALARVKPVTVTHLTTWEQVAPALDVFARAHVARFLATHRISNLARADRRAFLRDLARLLCDRDWLCLSQLMQGERPIAWNYGFRYGASWFWYQPTFDGQFEQYSTGNLLLASIIVEACESEQLTLVDLGLGAEGYKERFANETRQTLHVTASRSVSRTFAASLRYRMAETIQKSPRIETIIRKEVRRIGSLKENWRGKTSAGFASWALRSAVRRINGSFGVNFHRWPTNVSSADDGAPVLPLDLGQLSCAAMRYEGDKETEEYLLRSARRLQDSSCEGFVLHDAEGLPVHFAWTTPFERFLQPGLRLDRDAPEPNAVMIFDCWTPGAQRRRGYFRQAIAQVAKKLTCVERSVWISSAQPNLSANWAIEKAGFQFMFAMATRDVGEGQNPHVETSATPAGKRLR